MKTNRWKAIWLILLGAASYGVLSTFVKLGYRNGFTPAEITGSQVLFGAVTLWLLSLFQLRSMKGITWSDIIKLLVSGAFTGLTGYFYYLSLQVLDASIAVLLLFQFTWMGVLLGWAADRRAPTGYQWGAMALVMAGTVLASGILAGSMERVSVQGVVLGLLAACCYTTFIWVSGRVAIHLQPLTRSTWMVTGAAAAVLSLMPPVFLWNGAMAEGLWFWAILLSVFGMILPPYLYAKGAPSIETGLASVLGSVELPVVIVCSALLLQEPTGAMQWVGIIIILAGVGMSERRPASRASEYSV
ncbi:EamA family transporter [Paenibacillus xerothermodurans]|uniref:DMT family transporter n=1 Tax=Paenibacillus xerothermodurans TaxID=1977292 RepID=A0A2W1NYD4_PAEXE|nr:DMT family transporter [Paenibacillus xerothermodurans]PZE22736.1 DMT family transporter [Paenibacillus xerothermodurans]